MSQSFISSPNKDNDTTGFMYHCKTLKQAIHTEQGQGQALAKCSTEKDPRLPQLLFQGHPKLWAHCGEGWEACREAARREYPPGQVD